MKQTSKQFFFGAVFVFLILTSAIGITMAKDKKQDKKITLTVSVQEAEMILKALSELPLKDSGPLYFALQQQAAAQLQPPVQKPQVKSDTTKKKP